MSLFIRRLSLALGLVLAACGDSGGTNSTPPVDHVTVDPAAVAIDVGETRQLQVAAVDAGGTTIPGAAFTYATTASTVATVSSLGVITGLLPGTATITSRAGGKAASTAVTVFEPLGSIALTVPRTLLKESDTLRAIAIVRNERNEVVARDLVWSSSNSNVAVVTPLGLILGLTAGGPVTITASAGGKSASVVMAVVYSDVVAVKVNPDPAELLPGSTKQLAAAVTDEFGYPVVNRPIVWSSFNPAAATINETGLVTAVAIGESTISATVGGVTGQALVRVTNLAEARFRIEVTNHLSYPVEIMQNGVLVGTATGGGSTTIERPLSPTVTISWRMPKLFDRGETFGETYAPILNPTGAIPVVIDNVLDDGRIYFNPTLRNLSSKKVLADFPVRDNAVPCNCSIVTVGSPQEYGYWLWSATATLRVYRSDDLQLQGPFLSSPVPLGDLETRTGVWRFNLLAAP